MNHISVCFIQISTKSHANSLFSSGKGMFFWSHPWCFGPLGKFQHNIKISVNTARVSRLSVSYDYDHTFKGEGERKIQPRIKRFYSDIGIKRIQKWLNSKENHFKINPVFSKKPPLSPAVSKTVQRCKQVDLVDMTSMSVTKNGVEYKYILSILDVFSRFLKLSPLCTKDSNEVLIHLRGIFR